MLLRRSFSRCWASLASSRSYAPVKKPWIVSPRPLRWTVPIHAIWVGGRAQAGPGEAAGRLYLDAGDGYDYRAGKYAYRKYSYAGGKLTSAALHANPEYAPPNILERVEVLGVSAPKSAVLTVGGKTSELGVSFAASTNRLVVRMPNVPMASDWTIELK